MSHPAIFAAFILSALLCSFMRHSQASPSKKFKEWVSFKDVLHFKVAKKQDVYGIYLENDKLYTFEKGADYYYLSLPNKKLDLKDKREFIYEPYKKNSEDEIIYRHPLGKRAGRGFWLARAPFDKGHLLLDSHFKIAAFDKEGVAIAKRDIVLDRLKPPADTRGEPTSKEIAAYRLRLKKAYEKAMSMDKDSLTTGFVRRAARLKDSDGAQFLMATRLPGFRLVTVKCLKTDLSACEVKRACYFSGGSQLKAEDVTGIAYSKKRNLVLLGDKKYQRILVFRYDSCHHVQYLGVVHLPEQLKEMRNIFVDEKDVLWVSTKEKDPYLNASVYAFSAW